MGPFQNFQMLKLISGQAFSDLGCCLGEQLSGQPNCGYEPSSVELCASGGGCEFHNDQKGAVIAPGESEEFPFCMRAPLLVPGAAGLRFWSLIQQTEGPRNISFDAGLK